MKYLKILLPMIICLSSACETYLEVEIPDSEPRLVVNSLLEPGRPVMVHVTSSKSILEETQYEIIKDATVTITHNENVQTLQFTEGQNDFGQDWGAYTTQSLNPGPAGSYSIEVSHPAYNTATSQVTLPVPPEIKSISHQVSTGQSQDFWNPYSEVAFNLVFDDPVGKNFYEIDLFYEGAGKYTDPDGNTYETNYSQFAYLSTKNPAYEQNYRMEPGLLINDLLFDGEEAQVTFYCSLPPEADLDLIIYLRAINEDAYRYEISANLQQENRGDPLSQPVQVISNIQNGFGLVKGRTSSFMADKIFIPE